MKMLDGVQLELHVETIQPDEVYLLYTDVEESWDTWIEEDRGGDDYDYVGVGPGRYTRRLTRTIFHEKMLTGVITDDRTLDIVKGRMEDYARKWEDEAREKRGSSPDMPNFAVQVKYLLEKERKIVL